MQSNEISSIDLQGVTGGAEAFAGYVRCNDGNWQYMEPNPFRNGVQGACSGQGGVAYKGLNRLNWF